MSTVTLRIARPDPRLVLLFALALLLVAAAVMLLAVPVQQYVVTCERTAKSQLVCVVERANAAGTRRRWRVPLGSESASAAVRVMPRRRGAPRVLLYLETPGRAPVFAAEFEGPDAAESAELAAARLNRVLRSSPDAPSGASGTVRIEAAPPGVLHWLAWAGVGIMGALVAAAYRHVRTRDAPRGPTSPNP